jgi:hypothetical protein
MYYAYKLRLFVIFFQKLLGVHLASTSKQFNEMIIFQKLLAGSTPAPDEDDIWQAHLSNLMK